MCSTVLRFNLHTMNELQQIHGIRYATVEATENSVIILRGVDVVVQRSFEFPSQFLLSSNGIFE
jgi:hypothetical protein